MEKAYFSQTGTPIGSIIHFSPYNALEMASQEVEDPPETMHMTWGLWLHFRDALHRIEQKHDIVHVLRNARAADDILHYLDYVPKIGHDDHMHEIHEQKFEYEYEHENPMYEAEPEHEYMPEDSIDAALEEIEEHVSPEKDENEHDDDFSLEGISSEALKAGSGDFLKAITGKIGIEYLLQDFISKLSAN